MKHNVSVPVHWMRNYREEERHQITSSNNTHLPNVERMTKLGWCIPMKGLALRAELGLFRKAGLETVESFT